MPAYLESSNPANVALYARHGFAPCGVIEIPGGGPQIVTMWREPRPRDGRPTGRPDRQGALSSRRCSDSVPQAAGRPHADHTGAQQRDDRTHDGEARGVRGGDRRLGRAHVARDRR